MRCIDREQSYFAGCGLQSVVTTMTRRAVLWNLNTQWILLKVLRWVRQTTQKQGEKVQKVLIEIFRISWLWGNGEVLVCGLITRQTVSVVQDSWLRCQLFSTDGYGEYRAWAREEVWVISFLFFIFLFFYKSMIVENTNSDQGNGFDRYAGRVWET